MQNPENITLDRKWRKENTERLIAWEVLRRHVMHENRVPMTNEELCDTIGVSNSYTIRLLTSIQKKLNKDAE